MIYSFGWYLRKFIGDVKEKGGIPVLVSLTPRNEWPGGKVERRNDSYGKWYRDVVEATGVDFIDLHNITADALDKMGRKKAAKCSVMTIHILRSRGRSSMRKVLPKVSDE